MTQVVLAPERISVLVVEDNPADADLVREMLRDAGLVAAGTVTPEIHQVPTLRDALAAARGPFDVALLDLGLPDANDLQGLDALGAAVPELPAVVLTGARDPELAARALVAGAEDFLVKGDVQPDLLLRSLRFAVARHRHMARPRGAAEHGDEAGRTVDRAPRGADQVRRVLLVEDNPGDAELVRIALSEQSSAFAVHAVGRLKDALACLTSVGADAVLLDLGLPDATGVECVRRLRAAFPAVPVIVLSGNADAGVEAVRAGVQDYVLKSELDGRGLQRAIHYAIERNAHGERTRELAAERAAHFATMKAAKALEDTNQRLALATREARDALEREAAARAEAERRQQEMEALFASMIDPVIVYAEDGRVVSTNRAATEFFGLDLRHLTVAALIEASDIRSPDGLVAESLPGSRALRGAIVAGERLRVRGPAGERVILVNASPVRQGDSIRGAVCVYRDVTEQDRAEQSLREMDARKDHFLAMLSHELRNPLAPIRNSVYILDRAAPGGEQARRARTVIDRQVQHLTRLVDDLLDVTRISRGKISLHRERVDISALVRQVAEDHRSVFLDKGVELQTIPAPNSLYVSGDSTRIAQVIGNLLHNAAKFTPRGGHTALYVEQEGERVAAIRVRDSGEGIAPATLGTVFEPFVQGNKTLDRAHGGLGLGLALVKALARLHGGDATAHSDGPGKGSEFVVRLPLDPRPEASLDDEVAPTRTAPARRVLVIEDNLDAAETLKQVLEFGDHVVAIAGSGPQGLERARTFRPDVVLCDIGLPAMDGFEVASAFRADPTLRATALVALSGYAAAADLERSTEAGFDRHLAKPVALDDLERVMCEVTALRPRG